MSCTASMLGMSPNSRYPQSSCNTVDKLLSHKDKDDRERRILSRWLDSTKLSFIWDTDLTYVHEIYTMERFHVRKRMLTLSNSCLMYVPSEITGYVPSSITGWSHWGTHYVCAHNCITKYYKKQTFKTKKLPFLLLSGSILYYNKE